MLSILAYLLLSDQSSLQAFLDQVLQYSELSPYVRQYPVFITQV